jgi:hypothetical protein
MWNHELVAAFVFASVFANVILVATVFRLQSMLAELRSSLRTKISALQKHVRNNGSFGAFAFASPHHAIGFFLFVLLFVWLVTDAARPRR